MDEGIFRRSWWQHVPFTSSKEPPTPPASLDDAQLIPEATANIFSRITFEWMTPLLGLGYARTLQAPDLWKLQEDRSSQHIASLINESFERRVREADEHNRLLANGELGPGFKGLIWSLKGQRAAKEKEWREVTGKKKASLVMAINDSVKWWFWSAGAFKLVSDIATITSPLVVKAIIDFASSSYFGHLAGQPVPSIGKGIGLVFVLLTLQLIAAITNHHFFYRATSTGVLVRGGLITAIYNRSLRLTSRARSTLNNGKLVNHISTDVSRLDFAAGFFHMSWSSLVQLLICLGLLIGQLGVSALAGFACFVFGLPIQVVIMKSLFAVRGESMKWTDKRVRLIQELLGGMKVMKFFAWENPFLERLANFRKTEVSYIRKMLIIRAGNNALGLTMPAIASVVAFIVYSLTGHPLNPAIIFTSLTLFNLLRMPVMFLPMSMAMIADAANAAARLHDVFEAELLEQTYTIDGDMLNAVEVKGASFSWDSIPDADEVQGKAKNPKGPGGGGPGGPGGPGGRPKKLSPQELAEKKAKEEEKAKRDSEMAFKVRDVTLSIPRGQLVAIVGSVGSGKSSLLQGMIGEMRKMSGSVAFGGSVGYCPQTAWIQNATIRENICFGRPFEPERYWKAVRDACLNQDLDMLPNSDLTEVGEKGISLSGGQKQRVNICRAIYCDTEIQIFDDPFSALDAHVGKAVFQNVLQDSLSGKTRILVTHALHFLPQVDYIYSINNGRIAEQGTYADLIESGGYFSQFISEFGSSEQQDEDKVAGSASKTADATGKKPSPEGETPEKAIVVGNPLMQEEERMTGAVAGSVYGAYLKAARGPIIVPLVLTAALLMQGASTIGSYWLVWWQDRAFNQPQSFYMGVYAGLGVAQSLSTFSVSCCFALMTYFTSQRLHKDASTRILHAPMSFFDTTPLGRIMNRFSKDMDNIDNQLGESIRMFLVTVASVLGAVVLISVVLPWFLIAVAVISIVYVYFSAFYRSSAREFKRLDAILRSSVYSHFSETLTGLTTIRAYAESERFRHQNDRNINIENRAYWMTVANQRWLGVRLDILGSCLTFVVAMLAVGTRFTISPAQTGVVLAYILNVQQLFGWMVKQSADVENNMNAVERVIYYAQDVEQEAAFEIPEKKPPTSWPAQGRVDLKNIVMSYRPGLPAVVKGLSMSVNAGEKVGIVGRTGAGKSSIMTALFRIAELTSGSMTVDDIDISTIGLSDLRKALAIIPQDPLLFSGTLRSNLDPFNAKDDATLWDALKRVYLVDSSTNEKANFASASDEKQQIKRFSLDTVIEDEGNNLSVGQRSLVSLARALVKNSKIIVLDEATASVDYETDRKIQDTIATQFKDRTVLCIAHRLRTIIAYDRICVMDAGQVAEFDSPAVLYQHSNGIFRGMCERSNITLEDILHAKNATANV